MILKVKIFLDSITYNLENVFNQWMEEHPNIEIIKINSYGAGYHGSHSGIMIFYKEC